jgi:DNA-binding protein HU-beta
MAKPMTKSQIISYIADAHDLPKTTVAGIMETLTTLAYKQATVGFPIPGLGKLVVKHRKARMGRNPQTGQPIRIPAKRVVKFRVAKAAKDAILKK